MVGLNIALINGIKPMSGSGDGIGEYAYSMELQLRKRNKIDTIYSITEARKNDVMGLLKVNSALSSRCRMAAAKDYDIFHIVNQEVGFAAKDIKLVDRDNRVITTVHDVSRFESSLQRGLLQNAYNLMVKSSVKNAAYYSDFLLFDSTQTMAEVKKRFDVRHGAVVNIGIDGRFMKGSRKDHGSKFTVGYIGSFAYHKNVAFLLRAAALLKEEEINFTVYGIGSEGKNIESYVKAESLKRINLMGFAPEERKVAIYDSFDAFVFPSLYEGFGLPILEAQARGLPVIVYRHGKVPKEVKRYCFEVEDEEDMAQVIQGLKDNGYSEGQRKRATAYARSFTWEKCVKDTLKIYNQVLNK